MEVGSSNRLWLLPETEVPVVAALLRREASSDAPKQSTDVKAFYGAGPVSYTHLTLPTTPYV